MKETYLNTEEILKDLDKLEFKIANFRKEVTKDSFTLSPGQIELLNKIEQYFKD